ncbi:MAG TPA: hypothetical protein K8V06_00585 [Ligilactobacillus salivarius]|uniref:Uncharacterized protein n=2 Tax=Bacillota TaxID=1239 RepID=A0A921IAF3_9LACO|nr:hypothetical protein [Ligilactobacillus salivarius]PAY56703.1 hypothetical protein A8C41_04640 [Ligilactobacillus salivarius]PAY59051.1 hypothetical protein A8C40_06090 [Ligilactobacillus salivarius]HJG14626.1 hypothetical protein [Ligilactobacillus salivarius]
MKRSNLISKFMLALFFLVLAFISTYPAFIGHFFKLTMDGQIHLIRFESVADAIKNKELPPIVNFMGYGNVGEVFNGMYPWLSGLVFIIPRVLLSSPMHALFIGFYLLNILTILNVYLLVRKLSNNYYIRLIGVILYQLNAYHLTLMYSRNALGEALAYAFLPLLMLGCYLIWNNKKIGILYLALGMGMIINSHMISSILAFLLIIIAEIYRIFARKLNLKEIVYLISAGILSIPIIIFTVTNITNIALKNRIATTWRGLNSIDMWESLKAMLQNNITDRGVIFNIGIICFVLLCVLLVTSIVSKSDESWKKYILGAGIIYMLTLNIIPLPTSLPQTAIGIIQFTGRLLSIVMVLLVMGCVLFLKVNSNRVNVKSSLIFLFMIMSLLAVGSVRTYHNTVNDDPIRYYIDNNNYIEEISKPKDGAMDYALIRKNKQAITDGITPKFNVDKVSYDSITLRIVERTNKIPFFLYKGIPYEVKLNGKNVKIDVGGILNIKAKRGDTIQVSSEATWWNYATFIMSTVTILVVGIGIVFFEVRKKNRVSYKKGIRNIED